MSAEKIKWVFRNRFRRGAFGWKSQPAIKRIKEAVAEIKKVARKDKALAADGAVIFIEKLSPALERIDSSSGAIGSAVNHALENLAPIIKQAQVDKKVREVWLDQLWAAYEADQIPYIEALGDHWGELCGSKAVASDWADRLIDTVRFAWSSDPNLRGYFNGTTNCLSALLAAGRYDELLELLEDSPYRLWHYQKFGVKALVAMGKKQEAIRYAHGVGGLNENPIQMAKTCEEILLSSGLADEAYQRYALEANQAGTYLAWFRAVVKKYPHKSARDILNDLVDFTPGSEGKWFAAAKSAGLYAEAIALAMKTPCAPQTLTRAARDFQEKHPAFAMDAGLAALYWISKGHGYEITTTDVREAFQYTMNAAQSIKCTDSALENIRELVEETGGSKETLISKVLSSKLSPYSR